MIVVSDTSPIINLAAIDQIELLPKLFGKVVIPEMVYHEIVVQGTDLPGAEEVMFSKWVEVQTCSKNALFEKIRENIDPGEAEAIVLAIEIKADVILLDDFAARQTAQSLGINFTGLLGILVQAKKQGLIANIKPLIDELLAKTSFRLSQRTIQTALQLAGE